MAADLIGETAGGNPVNADLIGGISPGNPVTADVIGEQPNCAVTVDLIGR